MSGLKENGSVPSSLPPPQPKSPPELYGRRRELAKVQMLEREIGFLEEELKSIEGLQLASRSCKEVADYVIGNPDPLIPATKKIRRSCRFWKWLCGGLSCFKFPWSCCCRRCPSPRLKTPNCCCCCDSNIWCNPCVKCLRMPNKWHCCLSCWKNSKCFKVSKCSSRISWWWWWCCSIPAECPSCPTCTCTRRCSSSSRCYYPQCLKFKNICSFSHKSCCYPCYFCY